MQFLHKILQGKSTRRLQIGTVAQSLLFYANKYSNEITMLIRLIQLCIYINMVFVPVLGLHIANIYTYTNVIYGYL